MSVFPQTPPTGGGAAQMSNAALAAAALANAGSTVSITAPGAIQQVGFPLAISGSVSPAGLAVQYGISTSPTTPPGSFTAATVSGSSWSGTVNPSTPGTYYIWAEQTSNTATQTASSAIVFANVTITSPPSTATVGTAMNLIGAVNPSGQGVTIGLSTSTTTAPTSFTGATVSGTGWTCSLTPTTAGTYYIWALSTDGSVAISPAVTISAGSSALTFSLLSGSGNGSLASETFTAGTGAQANGNWGPSTTMAHTLVIAPNIMYSPTAIDHAVFWFDSSATNATAPGTGTITSAYNSGAGFSFNASNAGGIYPGNGVAGTFYGTYAMYNSSNVLLGVVKTNAITVT